jgi:ubiquinone/menaquinone biosynthesis C-methylase UbiE
MSARGLTLPKWRIRLQKYIVNEVVPKASVHVLDLGCGVGYGAVFAAMLGKNVLAVDISRSALHRADARAREENVQNSVSFIRCSATNLPLRHGSFDGAFCVLLIDAFKEPEQPLGEVARVLDNDGRLIIADLDPSAFSMMTIGRIMQFLDRRSGHPYQLHSPPFIKEILEKLSFTSAKIQRKHLGLSPPIYVLEARKGRGVR